MSPSLLVTSPQSLVTSHQSLMHTHHADGSDDECHPEKLKGSEVLPEDWRIEVRCLMSLSLPV